MSNADILAKGTPCDVTGLIIAHCTLGDVAITHKYDFTKYVIQNNSLCPSGDIALRCLPLNLAMKIIFDVGNGLLPSINTPMPEPRLSPIYVTIWHLKAKLSLLVAYGYHTPVSVCKSSAMKYTIPVYVL